MRRVRLNPVDISDLELLLLTNKQYILRFIPGKAIVCTRFDRLRKRLFSFDGKAKECAPSRKWHSHNAVTLACCFVTERKCQCSSFNLATSSPARPARAWCYRSQRFEINH
ncbi:BA75_05242T0 [Komagataella pastoris]|uniref:BA75_05242T0 n=1 Tax=Komagataella pastoris TaxID=4922 RepID=A0A1B2JHN9_PICPA|nr:BA75_05242T0 [Komagataella pastoris]